MRLVAYLLGTCLIGVSVTWLFGAVEAGLLVRESHRFASEPEEASLEAYSRKKRFIDVGPWRVAYIERGSGETVVLLHGCPFQSYEFHKVIPLLARHYHAVKDRAVERRWIPPLLPGSSRNIHVMGDLSPSREWCVFEFLAADSEQLRKSLKPVDVLPPSVRHVPSPLKSWWPSFLEGDLDSKRIHEAGLQLYVVEEPATASTTALELFAIDWAKGRGFLYGPPA